MRIAGILLFCIASLLLCLGAAYALYPKARLPDSVLSEIETAKPMEDFEQLIDLGDDFGSMSVIELMGFYLDSPPQPEGGGLVIPKRHFGGC